MRPIEMNVFASILIASSFWPFSASTATQMIKPITFGSDAPDLLINEVLFDPEGVEGGEGAWQFVELAATKPTNLGQFRVENSTGSFVFPLPSIQVSAGHIVLILLGPPDPEIENFNPSSGSLIFTTGGAWSDFLGVSTGGVRLMKGNTIVDQIFWGQGPATTSTLDLSFATGTPLMEGESIGRSMSSQFSGTSSDFAISGGKNANASTPGSSNIVELPSQGDLVQVQEEFINQLATALSIGSEGQGWLTIDSTNPSPLQYSASQNSCVASTHHNFEITVHGSTDQLEGISTIDFTRTTNPYDTGESIEIAGTLVSSSGTFGLAFQMTRSVSGFHHSPLTVAYTVDFSWIENGVSYPVSMTGTRSMHQTGINTWEITEGRSGWDFGGAGIKSSSAHGILSRAQTGKYQLASTVSRSYPSLLPLPGNAQYSSGEIETIYEEDSVELDGLGQIVEGTVDFFEQSIGGNLIKRLLPGSQGSWGLQFGSVSGLDFAIFSHSIPFEDAYGNPSQFDIQFQATAIPQQGKEVFLGQGSYSLDGNELFQNHFAFDPPTGTMANALPIVCMQWHNRPSISGGSTPKQSTPPQGGKSFLKKIVGVGETTVTCAAAGVAAELIKGKAKGAGKKAIMKTIGKAAGKKLIPVLGQALTACCLIKGVVNEFF